MKKLILIFSLLVCVFYTQAQSQLDSIYNAAKTYNNTNIIANTQLRAYTLNTLINKVLLGIKNIDTAARFAQSTTEYNMVTMGRANNTGTVNVSSIVQGAINAGWKRIFFPAGTYKLTNIQLKNGVMIYGEGVKTILKTDADTHVFRASLVLGGNNAVFKDVKFEGDYPTVVPQNLYYGPRIQSPQDAILIDSAYGVKITNVYGEFLYGYLVNVRQNGCSCGNYPSTAVCGVEITSCYASNGFGGIKFGTAAKYNIVTGGSYNNLISSFVDSAAGNNICTGVDFSCNYYGPRIYGGGNDGHGVMTGCVINHNVKPLTIDAVLRGYYFSNCTIYSDEDSVIIKNSNYINFDGGYMTVNSGTGKIILNTNTGLVLNNVRDLMGITSTYVITGTPPTIFKPEAAVRYFKDSLNKINAITSASSITPDADAKNTVTISALAANLTINAPTGTLQDMQPLTLRIKDNGSSRTLTFNSIYREGSYVTLPTATTAGKNMYLHFRWNATDSKWDFLSLNDGF